MSTLEERLESKLGHTFVSDNHKEQVLEFIRSEILKVVEIVREEINKIYDKSYDEEITLSMYRSDMDIFLDKIRKEYNL